MVSASGSSEDMALVKKLNALEVENKQLKKGKSFDKKSREGKTFIHLGGVIFWWLMKDFVNGSFYPIPYP